MPAWLTSRLLFGLGFFSILGLLLFSLYLQYGLALEPCPLCVTQRVLFIAVAVMFLACFVHGPGKVGTLFYATFGLVFSGLGLATASRQLWLQNLPDDQVPACGPSLEYMLEAFPLTETLSVMIRGSGNCAEVQWDFLGLTIPGWSAVAFAGFSLLCVFVMARTMLAKS